MCHSGYHQKQTNTGSHVGNISSFILSLFFWQDLLAIFKKKKICGYSFLSLQIILTQNKIVICR